MVKQVALTTIDNPHDPWDDYPRWNAFDTEMGYHSSSLLARVVKTSNDLPENLQDQDVETAIDEIVRLNASGRHKKIVRKT